jgi:aryl-alcohol dehydrogenase-like predicted oxidoreductase
MESRTLGSTGLIVTRLGLGLAALGRPGYINLGRESDLPANRSVDLMREQAETVLDVAWEEGIRYLDAARSYGRAEEFLAGWLTRRGVAPDAATVGSKWGYTYTAGWRVDADVHEVKEHSTDVLNRQWEESRRILGEHLDLYQIHSATLESGVLENSAVLGELARLRQEERVAIGLTLSGPDQSTTLRRAMEVEMDGEPVFQVVQATWNLLEPSAGPALREAHSAGIGVIVKESLANGRLAGRDPSPAFASRRTLLRQVADRLGVSPDRVAIAAALRQEWADVVLSGATTAEQLRSNVDALRLQLDAEAAELLDQLPEKPSEYWSRRGDLAWR